MQESLALIVLCHLGMMIKNLTFASTVLFLTQPTALAATPRTEPPRAVPPLKTQLEAPPRFAVNMQDGGLILKESTTFKAQNGFERTYRSRSFQKGYFGQGWCSDFESSLNFLKRGGARLESCQSSKGLEFALDKTASSYIKLNDQDDRILIKLGYYERRKKNQLLAKYNFQGQLIEVFLQNRIWHLKYDDRKLPVEISDSTSLTIKLKWHPVLSLIERLEVTGGAPASQMYQFRYEGFNLVQVKSFEGVTTYNYDDLDNMILRETPQSILKLEYNKEQDQVKKIFSDCTEVYEFHTLTTKKKVSKLIRTCAHTDAQMTQFEFDYDINPRLPAFVKTESLKKGLRLAKKPSNEVEL